MTFEEAAAVCDGAIIALSCLRQGGSPQTGEGSSSTARPEPSARPRCSSPRHFGADVTAVCNTKNLELVRSLGADHVIDYTQEDFTKNGETYDVVFDAVGKHSFTAIAERSLKPGGIYIATDGLRNVAAGRNGPSWFGDKRATLGIAKYTKDDVLFLKELIEAGEYRAVIDRRYPLEDVVEATKYVETQQKTGNVVLTVT